MFENGCYLRRQKRFKDDKKEAVRAAHRVTQQEQQQSISSTSGGSNGSCSSGGGSPSKSSKGNHSSTPTPNTTSNLDDGSSPNNGYHHNNSHHNSKLSQGDPHHHNPHHHHHPGHLRGSGGGGHHHQQDNEHLRNIMSGGHPGGHLIHNTSKDSHSPSDMMDKMDLMNGGQDCGGSVGHRYPLPLGDSGQLPPLYQLTSHHPHMKDSSVVASYASALSSVASHPFSINSLFPSEVRSKGDSKHDLMPQSCFGPLSNNDYYSYNASLYHHLPPANSL